MDFTILGIILHIIQAIFIIAVITEIITQDVPAHIMDRHLQLLLITTMVVFSMRTANML